jgi:hypothetical protein
VYILALAVLIVCGVSMLPDNMLLSNVIYAAIVMFVGEFLIKIYPPLSPLLGENMGIRAIEHSPSVQSSKFVCLPI